MRVLILEDNADRRAAMLGRLAESFSLLKVEFFDASSSMLEYMKCGSLHDVVLISLDHDLDMIQGPDGKLIDPGDGRDVARWLATSPAPLCPVIVHTTNSPAGGEMVNSLAEVNWTVLRVVPFNDLEWIDAEWFPTVRNAIVDRAPFLAIAPDTKRRFHELAVKRDAETLSDEEHRELIGITDSIELFDAARVEMLIRLAEIRGVTLDRLLLDIGAKPHL